ncbi:MAG: hypothetical protein WBB69_06785 [Anaerolineales bacterium]
MVKKAGEKTGQFGLWLTEYIRENHSTQGYQVYYDHGDSRLHDNVAVIKGFLGDTVTSKNKLTDVDVMVANQNHEVLLLIEIEESPLSPKTLLGDVFASLFCTRFAVKEAGEQKYFSVTPHTHMIIAGFIPRNNEPSNKLINKIHTRLREFSGPDNNISSENVDFVIDDDLDTCIRNLKDIVNKILKEN